MSTRKQFEKVDDENPSRKDMPRHSDSKTQPADTAGSYGSNINGTPPHDHNWKGRSTNTEGSDYHEFGRPTSGLHGNFAEKDASMEYLRERNKQGQSVAHFSGTDRKERIKTFGGSTAYDTMPIPEVYKPATSQGEVQPSAVEYSTAKKDRNAEMPVEQNTSSNKLNSRIASHLKNK